MKGQQILSIVLALGLLLALMAGSSITLELPVDAHDSTSPEVSQATSFPYVGCLAEADGLVSDRCDLRFSLYDAAYGGTHIGTTLEQAGTELVEGRFRVDLDFGMEAFAGEARWLELEVRCPAGSGRFTTLTPRQGLLPSPGILAPLGLWTLPEAIRPEVPAGPDRAAASPLVNRSFEHGVFSPTGSPTGWVRDFWNPSAVLTWDNTEAYVGIKSVKIMASTPNDAGWIQTVAVQPNTFYLLSGWIKTQDVAHTSELEDAGANLSLYGTWTHTEGLFGTHDWTYVDLMFNSGENTEVTVGGRLGYWAGTTTGTAWFDGLQLTPIDPSGPPPSWKALVLIYRETDFSYSDSSGDHRVVAALTPDEIDRAASAAERFFEGDVPALDSGNMLPVVTIRYPEAKLTDLVPQCGGYWPDPGSTAPERDPAFDTVLVVWDSTGTDLVTGQPTYLSGGCGGMSWAMGTGQTYASFIISMVASNQRNVFKHEWGHSIVFYHDAAGTAPKPPVDNHINDTNNRYVHCPSGHSYILVDETDDNPIPWSIYNNELGFTHDYYSGTTARPEQPTNCLGITPQAWAMGGPVSRPHRTSFYDVALAPSADARSAASGATARYTLHLTNIGNVTDSFELTVTGHGWPTSAPSPVGPLRSNESLDIDVSVRIPTSAASGDVDTAILTATSQGDSAGSASATLTTQAVDHRGGFVTGGGWIMSPQGACPWCEDSPEAKANFGFVSKYKKGADTPTGNTEFRFKAGNLNFHTTSYDWLEVTGRDHATFKGLGSIDGAGEYQFQLWAGDKEPDTFRIKIWWEENDIEHVVYDNGMDQPIGGGNIAVHTKKVRSGLDCGNSGWTAPWTFTVMAVPAAPSLSAPVDSSRSCEAQPAFAWSRVVGATSYGIQVATEKTYATPVISDTTTSANYTATVPLSPGTYYWRARSANECGPGAWSSDWSLDRLACQYLPSVLRKR